MKKEEVLQASREENKKKDLALIEAENKGVKIAAIAILGVYSARSYKLDQLNDKLSRIQVCTLEEQGLVANGEFNAKIEKNKVKVNMIVRVINVSGEKLLNAQIKDNISGAKIQVDSMEANKEKTYEILQNVNNSTKLDLELLEYEFQE